MDRHLRVFVAGTLLLLLAVIGPADKVMADAAAPDRLVLEAAAHATDDLGRIMQDYTGTTLDEANGIINVYGAGLDADEQSALVGGSSAAWYQFHDVNLSANQLQQIADRVAAEVTGDTMAANGITAWGVDPVAARVWLGVDRAHMSAHAQEAIKAHFGRDRVVLQAGESGHLTSRLSDSSPWYGGDYVVNGGHSGDCTAGPSVRNSSGAKAVGPHADIQW